MQAQIERLHEHHGGVDKGFAGQPMEREGSVTDGQESTTSSKKRMSSTASDMSKQQVEELVTKLTIDKMKTKWFVDEIYYKLKSELVESGPSMDCAVSDTAETPSTEGAPSPKSSPIAMAPNPQRKLYQATVEDDPDDSSNPTRTSQSNDDSDCSSPSSVASDSTSSKVSNMSAKRRPGSGVLRSPDSQPSSPRKRPTVRFSDRGPIVLHGRGSPTQPSQEPLAPRREGPEVAADGTELSAVDLKWGKLFDEKGEPTRRLGEFLRGIANYLITEYTPTNSLVVTPDKLLTFYTKYKVDSNELPFDDIFNASQRDYTALEWLYQDLGCSYHLVQGRPNSSPRIPALTPSGFQDWMVRQIQTNPDQEARRLNTVVKELPITADGPLLDGKQERLPRQLSRHLLPAAGNEEAQAKVLNAIFSWIQETRPEATSPRESRESHYHRSSRTSDEKSGRYRPDDYGSSRHHHKSRDSHSRPSDRGSSSRKDRPGGLTSRAHSEGNILQAKSRSPTSNNRYRTSVGSLNGMTDDYHLSSSNLPSPTSHSHHPRFTPAGTSGDRRAREQEYRYYQGRSGHSDATPRTIVGNSGTGSRRQSLVLDTTPREDAYDGYNPRSSRGPRSSGLGIDESYRGGNGQ